MAIIDLGYLLAGSLACWRVTGLLQSEAGPFEMAARMRAAVGHSTFECFLCLSVWVAAPVAAAAPGGGWRRILLWPAVSAGAVLVQRMVFPASLDGAVSFHEE